MPTDFSARLRSVLVGHSEDRVAGIVADAGAELVLTKETVFDAHPDPWPAKRIDLLRSR
jgi:hypothetical protein